MGNDVVTVEPVGLEVLWEDVVAGLAGTDAPVRWTDGAVVAEPDTPGAERWQQEQLLAKGACLGDEGALEELCHDEWHHVHKLVAGSVPDPVEAEELTLEVFARAIARLSHFPYVETSFRSYLLQFARRLLSERWRAELAMMDGEVIAEAVEPATSGEEPAPGRRSRHDGVPAWGVAGPRPVLPPVAGTKGRGAIVLIADHRRELVAALERLPDRSREVLHLRLLEGRSAAEIGADWGRTPDAVRRVQTEALRALRSEMEGHGTR